MDLMRLPVTEVVAVSVLHGSTGPKKKYKNTAQAGSSAQSFITSRALTAAAAPRAGFARWTHVGERKETSVMGYMTCCDL